MIRRAENLGQRRSELDALTARLVSLRVGSGRYADARRLAERLLAQDDRDHAPLQENGEADLALSGWGLHGD